MTAIPLQAVAAIAPTQALAVQGGAHAAAPAAGASFSQVLLNGIETVNQRAVNADAMVRAFAIDDSIPVHQVTFALEQARLSLELMMQVRARLVESYQRMMEMQL
jgi:flagellar hook-basal body complex protein FliE